MKYFSALILALFLSTTVWSSYVVQNGSVTASKLATGAVTQSKLAARATGTTVGLGGIAVSASSGVSNTTSGTFATVTNLSVTLTTSGRPVHLLLQSDGVNTFNTIITAGASTGTFGFFRGSTGLGTYSLGAGGSTFPGSMDMVDVVAAGTYTYTLKFLSLGGSTTSVSDTVLIAFEL